MQELILDEAGRKHLQRLWDEFDFIADYTGRTWDQYYFNQSGEVLGTGRESGSERPSDADVRATPTIFEVRDRYLAKAKQTAGNDAVAQEAIRVHYQKVNDTLRRVERMRNDAETQHLDALVELAERAYRRPLTKAEADELLTYYGSLREKTGLTHEEAIRDSVVSVLMSPDYLYRVDLVDGFGQPAKKASAYGVPLSPYALANRLSYFLWSSMPDEELMAKAKDGSLLDREVLAAQTRRMLQDERMRGLAIEFTGNWLDFRRFGQHNSVDRARFPAFDETLREAMFEEPIRLVEDAIRNNSSVLDLVYGGYTFVNPALARHYGMKPYAAGDETQWVRVDDADRYGRGGLLPMAVFLTQSSPGLRTSPVKRGFWIVRRVLGEEIPPPPPVVPELPEDESASELPLTEMLAQHRANPACAGLPRTLRLAGLGLRRLRPGGRAARERPRRSAGRRDRRVP